jgi:hypothetical protein
MVLKININLMNLNLCEFFYVLKKIHRYIKPTPSEIYCIPSVLYVRTLFILNKKDNFDLCMLIQKQISADVSARVPYAKS